MTDTLTYIPGVKEKKNRSLPNRRVVHRGIVIRSKLLDCGKNLIKFTFIFLNGKPNTIVRINEREQNRCGLLLTEYWFVY